MIDIHSHILPGIDDGAPDLETAVAMCRLAADDGCTAMIATPHQRHDAWPNSDSDQLRRLRDELQSAVGERPLIHLGAEIRVGPGVLRDLDAADGTLTPLAGSRYLLLEFARGSSGDGCEDLVHELVVGGWRPILAHPEFIGFLAENPSLMQRLAAAGALFQVTAMSVTGDFGRRARRRAWSFLHAELAHFVASDSHGVTRRPPGLLRARRAIATALGDETAARLAGANARAVLENRELTPAVAAGS